MTRNAWMPDPTLSAWVTFLSKAVPLSAGAVGGVFLIVSAALGAQALRGEMAETRVEMTALMITVDTLTVEMGGMRADVDGLTGDLKSFIVEMRCVVDKFVEGETLGYRSCVPKEANGGETQ